MKRTTVGGCGAGGGIALISRFLMGTGAGGGRLSEPPSCEICLTSVLAQLCLLLFAGPNKGGASCAVARRSRSSTELQQIARGTT